jgi:superfamily II DNA or RNA helicase
MSPDLPLYETLPADSFLEYAFLRWVLTPAMHPAIKAYISPQQEIEVAGHSYRLDYAIIGQQHRVAVELDGFEYHGQRNAFTYDRLRQNDLQAAGWKIARFSYDSIRLEAGRCIAQLQAILAHDPLLASLLVAHPIAQQPDMDPDPLYSLMAAPRSAKGGSSSYFDTVRARLNLRTLRECQRQAFTALANYYGGGGTRAACVMSVGAGKTALGVLTCLAFTRRRALVITPGSVIRGTFDRAFDHQAVGNVLYGLPGGPLIPGCKPPRVLTLDRDEGPVRRITRKQLQSADVLITNFHSLGTGDDPDDLLAKLDPGDIDLIVIDEAHIAAADSYQRAFRHFAAARTLLISACFQRLDGRPIDADVVYRYRLIDSIADGHAKNLRVHRFAPTALQTVYEMVWPDGTRQEIVGREALLKIIEDERKLARITAKSDASIRQVMRAVREALDDQIRLLHPVKPRVLFSALGQPHAEQIAHIAEAFGIPCATLHHSMSEERIRTTRARFEQESGDLQGIVQLKMLGQGYDFPPITVVVPMRPYGSFNEFYQFVGRGIRVLQDLAVHSSSASSHQFLDIIYHAELGLDEHIDAIYRENDMDPVTGRADIEDVATTAVDRVPTMGNDGSEHSPEAFVLFEPGKVEQRIVHDEVRIEQRRTEREQEALAQRYALYAQSTKTPLPFDQFMKIMRALRE